MTAGWYISLELDLPPSANRLYVRSRATGNPVLSAEHRQYREYVAGEVMAQTTPEQRQAIPARLALLVLVERAKHRDLDNLLKCLGDSLQESLGFDDRHIDMIEVKRHDQPALAPCVVRLWDAEA